MNKSIISSVADYYSAKLNSFGTTARGVDWNSVESQELRFIQLLRLLPEQKNTNNSSFVILDYGCGFGSLYSFMENLYENNFKFIGYDISSDMIHQAKQLHNDKSNAIWINCVEQLQEDIDYVTASGIFNVRLNFNNKEWQEYIAETLNVFDKLGKRGFAFNMLTSYSDKEYMRDDLYYADPLFYFDHCKRRFSKNVALLHDYNLYEFTVIVRK
jgi:SAM-dependent methyltransferase